MAAKRTLLLMLALLLAPLPAVAQTEANASCSVPCGYIYPLILIGVENGSDVRPIAKDGSIEVPATLTYRFDAMNEGFTVPNPNEPIVVTFEFPRKPEWAGMAVEPARVDIPILPQYLQPDASDPSMVKMEYVYTTDVTITLGLEGQAVLQDGFDYAKLLVFAKSTESGLYKAGYGIKEFRVAPEGAIHESDLAPAAPMTIVDAEPFTHPPVTASVPGLQVTLTPPPEIVPWQPGTFGLDVGLPATVTATLLDESGVVAYNSGPRRTESGVIELNLTLPGSGRHTLAVFVEPPAGARTFVPQAVPLPIVVGPTSGDAIRFPREFKGVYSEVVAEVRGNSDEPMFQFEKSIPFPVHPGSSGAGITLALKTPRAAAVPTGAGNINLQLIDPAGAVILQGTVDAGNPVRAFQAGALPGHGWFHLRVSGAGVPDETAYDVKITVSYDDKPVVRRATDGVLDALTSPVSLGRVNATLVSGSGAPPAVWSGSPHTVVIERDGATFDGVLRHAFSFVDLEDGTTVSTSGLRRGSELLTGWFTPPAPGRYLALVTLAPAHPGAAFEPFTFGGVVEAGDPAAPLIELPKEFVLHDMGLVDGPLPMEGPIAEYRLPAAALASTKVTLRNDNPGAAYRAVFVDASGEEVDPLTAKGSVHLRLMATTLSPSTPLLLDGTFAYPDAGTIANPVFGGHGDGEAPSGFVPSTSLVLGFGALAVATFAAALVGRHRLR